MLIILWYRYKEKSKKEGRSNQHFSFPSFTAHTIIMKRKMMLRVKQNSKPELSTQV